MRGEGAATGGGQTRIVTPRFYASGWARAILAARFRGALRPYTVLRERRGARGALGVSGTRATTSAPAKQRVGIETRVLLSFRSSLSCYVEEAEVLNLVEN